MNFKMPTAYVDVPCKWTSSTYSDMSEEERLKAENAKLRKLVLDMYLCSDETCTDCEYHDHSGEGFWCKRGVGWKRARMRELGVEVGVDE